MAASLAVPQLSSRPGAAATLYLDFDGHVESSWGGYTSVVSSAYDQDGNPKPDFVLNQDWAKTRQVLLAGDNFGCGSSREHAPWALTQYGFRAVISTSFADIFKNNSLKNGLLPIVVDQQTHAKLMALPPDATVKIDLATQRLTLPDGSSVEFPIDPYSKNLMLEGVDELGYILQQEDAIRAYEAARQGSINTLA